MSQYRYIHGFHLYTLEPHLYKVRDLYKNLEKAKLKATFLQNCIDSHVIPHGLRVHVNIAHNNRNDMVDYMNKLLSVASTKFLFKVTSQIKLEIVHLVAKAEYLKHTMITLFNEEIWEWMKSTALGRLNFLLRNMERSHINKLNSLLTEKNLLMNHNKGSVLVTGSTFHDSGSTMRPHRKRIYKKNNKNKKRSKKYNTIENINQVETNHQNPDNRDPLILTSNVQLTSDQIDICRLSDKFIPTPTNPVDVADQLIGTHEWAERLRWNRCHHINNKNKSSNASDTTFIKQPWYKPSGKPAPKGDAALEAFIDKCSHDFLDSNNKRKIKDNLTKGQRSALIELKKLPNTHGAACRYSDKAGNTVITSIKDDEEKICSDLADPNFFNLLDHDPTPDIIIKVREWASKYEDSGDIDPDVADFVRNISDTHPARCKLLIKTHKKPPFPHRLLLTGSGTPIQPLSKFIQLSLAHLTKELRYQLVDSKHFINKIEKMNECLPPLPETAVLVSCDVEKLYPSVDNNMGIPAVSEMLSRFPSPLCSNLSCILDGLELVLNNNTCMYVKIDGSVIYASPNNGTAMGPCHAPDYVDIFMGILDDKLVNDCPINLIDTICNVNDIELVKVLNWSRFRDDGFIIIPDKNDLDVFVNFLQSLCPNRIKWTIDSGRTINFLDVTVSINENGKLITDVFSKNSHSYLAPSSCHNPCIFKGLAKGMGRRLRLICSDDTTLKQRILEYAKYLVESGWNKNTALNALESGANINRKECFVVKNKTKNPKKIAWITLFDPRLPNKSKIINKNIEILHSNPINKDIFPKKMLIAADRRRKNIGEIYKPSVPSIRDNTVTSLHSSSTDKGFFTCNKKCDSCRHSQSRKTFTSRFDNKTWSIRDNLSCSTSNVIYIVECKTHADFLYVGSTTNFKKRWANHKSDSKLKKTTKCIVAKHYADLVHPSGGDLDCLIITPIEAVRNVNRLAYREFFWQARLGTFQTGGNERKDMMKVLKNRVQYNIS